MNKKSVKPTESNDYLTIQEVSDLLRLSVSHIYTLTSQKKIPHIKLLGKKLLFQKDAINHWIKEKSVGVK